MKRHLCTAVFLGRIKPSGPHCKPPLGFSCLSKKCLSGPSASSPSHPSPESTRLHFLGHTAAWLHQMKQEEGRGLLQISPAPKQGQGWQARSSYVYCMYKKASREWESKTLVLLHCLLQQQSYLHFFIKAAFCIIILYLNIHSQSLWLQLHSQD